ncbi:putative endonuclease 4 [Glandiceps talaboti]
MPPKRKSTPLKDYNVRKNKRLKTDNKVVKSSTKKSPNKTPVKKTPPKKTITTKKKSPVKKSPPRATSKKAISTKKKSPPRNRSLTKVSPTRKGGQKRTRSSSVKEQPQKRTKTENPYTRVFKVSARKKNESTGRKTNNKVTKQNTNAKGKKASTKQTELSKKTVTKVELDEKVERREQKVDENSTSKETIVTTESVDGRSDFVDCSGEVKQEELKDNKDSRISGEVDIEVKSGEMLGQKIGKFVGAHVSIAGGIENAVTNAVDIGAKAFALFLRSQRQWVTKPLKIDAAERFKENCRIHAFPSHLIIPHGSYLMNCGSPNEETLEKSRNTLVDELKRCEMLGLTMFNFHPGSSCGEISVEECLDRIGESINQAHAKTVGVVTVIENMSCQGSTVGGKFEELKGIIDRVKDKSRVGVCLDTCHAFAAGHNIATEEGYDKVMSEFDNIVGFEYLKAVHLNDSMGDLGCHRDRHENIGKGKIGLSGFRKLMNDPRFDNIPMVLETPADIGYDKEIKQLYSLVKTKPRSDVVKKKKTEIHC